MGNGDGSQYCSSDYCLESSRCVPLNEATYVSQEIDTTACLDIN